jgi:hypothetical protein
MLLVKKNMIYLMPSSGLCNRMRSIESTLNLCEKYNKDLTILWIKNQYLNCDFQSLFLPIQNSKVTIKIQEFENNFIKHYLNKIQKIKNQKFSILKYFIYHFKNYRHKINLDFKTTLLLWKIEPNHLILNKELRLVYNKTQLITSNIEKLDNVFIENTNVLFKRLFTSSNNVFIESCYRISPLNNINIFKPENNLNKIIRLVTQNFNNTIGIHIRRSDHKESTKRSKTSYFTDKMDEYISQNNNVNFFLATDDIETKDSLIKKYRSRIITNDIKTFDRDQQDAIQFALVDLYCLSKTKKIIGSYHSTFSQMAAVIGEIECIIVY